MDSFSQDLNSKLKNVCRICLENDSQFINIFYEEVESNEILNKINLCFGIYLKFEKHLPFAICKKCITELTNAYSFKVKCLKADERFSNYCEKLSVELDKQTVKTDIKIDDSESEFLEDAIQLSDIKLTDNNLNAEKSLINNTFKCNTCNKELKTMVSLLKHKVSMHEKRKHVGRVTGFGSGRHYHCKTCSYTTPHSQTLVNHVRRHDGERPYNCECGKSFTQASSLAAHRKTHSTTTYFTCSMCGKQFKHASALKKHSTVHENGNYICNICQKILKSKDSLRAHIHRHYNICNYNCEDCGDTFVTSAELLNHRKKHSIDKKIECHLCRYRTHTKKNLITHLKRHIGDKAFKCEICQVAFYTKYDLQRHRRVHSREKPFSCPTCAQRFTHSTSLNKHMKNVHGVEYKWGDIKWKETKKLKLAIKRTEIIA